jgi:hypothetical protein
MDKDSGMAGVSGLSQRDQRRRQDAGFVGATQAREPQAGVFWLWSGVNEIAETYELEDGICRGPNTARRW